MAKRSPKSAKKSSRTTKSSGAFSSFKVIGLSFLFAFIGVVGGYAWRSYAPVPFFEGTKLTDSNLNQKDLSEQEEKVKELEQELEKIEEMKAEKEAELGDSQIKAILSDS